MTPFLLIAVALTAIALACVLYPLLRTGSPAAAAPQDNLDILRDQLRDLERARADGMLAPAAHTEAVDELARRVHDEAVQPAAAAVAVPPQRLLAGALTLLVPLVAAGLYYHAGSPAALAVTGGGPPPGAARHEITAADVSTLIQGLAERLQAEPANADGWYMLARSYTAIGRYQDAVQAYQRLLVLVPDDAAVLADYADVLATVQDGALAGRPEQLARQALALEPDNVKALALTGSAAFQRGAWTEALTAWERALAKVPAAEPMHASLQRNVAAARERMGGAGSSTMPAAAAPALTGTVTLAPALAAQARPTDTVFIFARAVDGPRAPLAVQRITVAQLPYRFVLDDSMAMSPALRLSGATRVIVSARVARSGSATPAAGDLAGSSPPVAPTAADIAITIDARID